MLTGALLKGMKGANRRELAKSGGVRFGSVDGFLRRMAAACGKDEMAANLKVDPAEITRAIKSTKGRLTYFDADHCSPAAHWFKEAGKLEAKGTPLLKADGEYSLSEGSILDFDCTITSRRRDRDGDVLDPKGAIIDPKMPLLWQHLPFSPIGKMIKLLDQNEDKITGRFMVCDTPLGRDAAVLIRSGCLRISHGFAPIEYNPLKDENGKDLGGWHISKYAMMEASAVSIPSNVDAEIDAWSAGKLHHPLVKHWCKLLNNNRKKLFTTGGELPPESKNVTVTILLKGIPAGVKAGADDEEKEDEEEEDKDDAEDATGKADDEDADDDEGADEDGDGDDDAGDSGASEDGGKVRALGEIIDAVKEMAGDQSLPKEAQRRMATVAGMFEDVEESIGKAADTLIDTAGKRDIAGMFSCMADLTESCVGFIGRAAEELERVASVEGLSDSASKSIGAVVEDAKNIVAAVGALTGAAADAEDAADADPDAEDEDDDMDPEDGEDDEDDKDDDAEEEKDDDGDMDDEDDEDDSELEEDDDEEKDEDADDEKDDDEADEKDEDAEDEKDSDEDDEKGSDDGDEDDENPDVDQTGTANPGVSAGRGAGRRRLSKLLGRQLLGEKLTEIEREELKKYTRGKKK
jgi:hypothetical protein